MRKEAGGINPFEKNADVIHDALLSMVQNASNPNTTFFEKVPLVMTLRDRSKRPMLLSYKSEFRLNSWLQASLAFIDPNSDKEIAEREWSFWLGIHPRKVEIDSYSGTNKNWEGNGLGMGLIMNSDVVIEHVIGHFTIAFKGKWPIEASITDISSGHIKVRNKWTTAMAFRLGYTQVSENQFKKRYK